MANILIRSDEANAAATALLWAARGHNVCLLAPTLSPGTNNFSYFGHQRTVTLRRLEELEASGPNVGVVFAEGEDVQAGISSILESKTPDLLVIIGGGISAAVHATEAAKGLHFDSSRILHVGGFLVGGNASAVKSEKQSVIAGFLAKGTPSHVLGLAQTTLPQVLIGNGFSVALSSVNALVHLPPMIFNAMSVERGADVRFYVEGFGDSVCRLIDDLDAERLRLGTALGFMLLPLGELMDRSSGPEGMPGKTMREKINAFPSYQSIKLPSSFGHRFLAHELRSTFAPMAELARMAGVGVPTINSVVRIGEILLSADLSSSAKIVATKFLALTKV
ncbi:NAD/NADP octopine/nopaline dehydrogenase family protein [Paeniglutamicibacter sulfureus]|uniref:Opine dehydrogenase domain-containing protein n=1 Tax=Paeniglutamicibacter sulfureus TaxID=43666 RepID=A0ABU2BJW6_9MICC|nr:NAD/NADP octopine/nopaline dehydrogenase family protein [Paeniglutamicibacter sulfureus]MDR7358942.1 hypothetical protein [Paeniglutamicibacter sulfureus]